VRKYKLSASVILGSFLFFLSAIGFAQGPPPAQPTQLVSNRIWITPAQPMPQQVPNADLGVSGNPGQAMLFYWVVSRYPLGNSTPAGPFSITNAPNTLSVSNFVIVNFTPVSDPGVTYDVLKTSTPAMPSGSCACAVATNVTSLPLNDQSNSTSGYTVTTFDPNTANLTLTNEVQGAGSAHLILRKNGVFVCDVSTGCGGGGGGTPAGPNGSAQINNNGVFGSIPVLAVGAFGVLSDGQVATDCYMTSGSAVLTCESGHFLLSDVAKKIAVYGSGPTTNGFIQPCSGSITAFTSSTQVTTSCTAGNSTTHTIATVTSATRTLSASALSTVYNATAHGFHAGQMVNVQMTNITDASFSGVFPISSVTANTFTVGNWALMPQTSTGGGTADGHSEHVVWGTDNTTTMQAAVDACAGLGGCAILAPKGLYVMHGVNLPCSQIGNFTGIGLLNCTLAYNNITFRGDGIGVSVFENWDIATSNNALTGNPGLINLGASATGVYNPIGSLTQPLRNIEISGITFQQIKYPTVALKAVSDLGATSGVKVHHSRFVNFSAECLYQSGQSEHWDVHDNSFYQCGLGGPATSTSDSALNMNGNYSQAHDNFAEDYGQCMEGAGHDDDFQGNTCDGHGPDIQSSASPSPHLFVNLSSGTYGIWNWSVRNSRAIANSGVDIENVLGMLGDVLVENNEIMDDTAGISCGTGRETNNVVYGPQPPSIHGTCTIRNNRFTYSGAQFPVTYALSINGNQSPYLQSSIWDGNNISFNFGFCGGTPTFACTTSNDCTAGACVAPIGAFSGAKIFSGQKWQPSVSYAGLVSSPTQPGVVVPSLDNTFIYMNKGTTGTSGTTEPNWCTVGVGCTVTDGGVTWTLYGRRPTAVVSNTNYKTPPGIGQSNLDITLLGGVPKSAFQVTNYRSNLTARFNCGANGTAAGLLGAGNNDCPFTAFETIPANFPYSDDTHYSDTLPIGGIWSLGQRVLKVTPVASASPGWIVTTGGRGCIPWTLNTAFLFGDFVCAVPDDNHAFRQTVLAGCTSGGAQPTWNTGGGSVTSDNTCSWTESGQSAQFGLIGNLH